MRRNLKRLRRHDVEINGDKGEDIVSRGGNRTKQNMRKIWGRMRQCRSSERLGREKENN